MEFWAETILHPSLCLTEKIIIIINTVCVISVKLKCLSTNCIDISDMAGANVTRLPSDFLSVKLKSL